LAVGLIARQQPGPDAAWLLSPALLLIGAGAGAVITPNQALSLVDVDPRMGSTAGAVLQTAQRIGAAIGQAVIGAAFFAALPAGVASASTDVREHAYARALSHAVTVTLVFTLAALALGLVDLHGQRRRRRRDDSGREAMPPGP